MRRVSLVILTSALLASSALATTYVRVEKDGTKTYSDRPLPGGQPIDIQPAQTYSAPAPAQPSSSGTRPGEEQALANAANFRYQCAMTPRAEETFHNPETVTLSVALTPGLRSGDEVQFSVDGNAVPEGEAPTSVTLTMPDRGAHIASVRVFDRSGKSVCDANTTFHVQRTGLNSPANRRPSRPTPPRPTPH